MATSIVGPGALNAQAAADQAREQQMLTSLNAANGSDDDAKIAKGAQQFEAMLLNTWLQQAEQSFATVPGAEDEDDASGRDQMMSLGTQSLAQSLAATGGIGIAKMIAKAMHRAAEKATEAAGQDASPAKSADETVRAEKIGTKI